MQLKLATILMCEENDTEDCKHNNSK